MGAWSEYKKRRLSALRCIIAERNRLHREAIFEEELERVKELDKCISFLQALNFDPCQTKCPLCGNEQFVYGDTVPTTFTGSTEKKKKKVKNLNICYCKNCGWYSIEGW